MEQPDITRSDLGDLVRKGILTGGNFKQGLEVFRDRAVWNRWALGALFCVGVGHILAGIIFFFAFNWMDLSAALKFAIVQGALVGCVVLWVALRLESLAAQAFGIAATVLIGVLLAVFGQVFQTPAAIYTPFLLWACLSLPFALASKSMGHWAVWLSITVFAVLTYASEGVEPMAGRTATQLIFLALSAGLIILASVYQWASRTMWTWAKTSWFHLSVLSVGLILAVLVFTGAFWDPGRGLIWAASFALIICALALNYRFWPTLAALSVTTFAIAVATSQFGFRVIFSEFKALDDFYVQLFLTFLWMTGLTFALAKVFRFYQARFGVGERHDDHQKANIDTKSDVAGRDVSFFAAHLGLDPASIANALKLRGDETAPWYVDVLLGLSGVVSAIFAALFIGSVVAMFFMDESYPAYALIGFIVWTGSLALRRSVTSKFGHHFFNTLMLGGGAVFAGALNLWFHGGTPFIFGAIFGCVLTLWLVPDRVIEFLMALAFFSLMSYGLVHYDAPRPYIWLTIVATIIAVIGLTIPIRKRLFDAAGAASLIALPIAGAGVEQSESLQAFGISANGVEIAVSLMAMFGAVLFLNGKRPHRTDFRPPMAVLIPMSFAIAVMPLGSAAALMIALFGFILGARALAIVGAAGQIYFMILFYYDLNISLWHKSILLLISGLIFVAIWAVFSRHERSHV